MQRKYLVGGIVIETSIEFPELLEINAPTDVVVAYGDVPKVLKQATTTLPFFSCNENDVLFRIDAIAWYHVQDTSKVTISLIDSNRKYDAEKYIFTLALGVLSLKKGFFPLHGGGIVHNGEAYLFTGPSGAGKSTTTMGLLQKGFKVVGDDISNLFLNEGRTYVHPCFPRFKLWQDSLQLLQLEGKGEYKLRSNIDKYLVPVGDNFSMEAIPVKRVYFLRRSIDNQFSFKEIDGAQSFQKIRENIYKPWLVKVFSLTNHHFDLTTQMAKNIECKEFYRPFDNASINKMYDLLIEDIMK